jgi:glycosyltransferase involved in cell wall biosynthesis
VRPRGSVSPDPFSGRVCLLTETFHPVRGGGETQARAVAAGLVSLGWVVLVLTRRSDASLPKHEMMDGATVRRVPPTGRSRGSKWSLLVTALWALFRYRREYDAVLVSGFRILGVPAVLVSRLFGKRCLLKADSLGEMSGEYFAPGLARLGFSPTSFPFSVLLRARNDLLRRATAFIAISSVIEAELIECGVEARRLFRVPNSVDLARFRPVDEREKGVLRQRLNLPEGALVVVYTGRLVTYKGLPTLLAAWQKLDDADDRLLALVGAGGMDIHNCEDDMRRYVQAHGLSGSVVFCGEVDHVQEYLQASDAFVFPSENEAFGISVIEAMAVGIAVVSSDAGGLRDIIQDGVNGLRFPTGDCAQLTAALSRVLGDSDLRTRLGAEARKTVENSYAEEVVVERYAALLQPDPATRPEIASGTIRDA